MTQDHRSRPLRTFGFVVGIIVAYGAFVLIGIEILIRYELARVVGAA